MLSELPPPEKLSIITFFRNFRNYFCFNIFLPFLGKDKRMGDNPYPPRPSLIREGGMFIDTSGNIRRPAFTLAEVLITLGIIGIVASLTMPTLIANYKKQETISRLKKAYSIINQALKLSEAQNGEYSQWEDGQALGADVYLQKYWLPYFNVLKICYSFKECGYTNKFPYKELKGTQSALLFSGNNSRIPFITSDGIVYIISIAIGGDANTPGEKSSLIYIDINGSKKPNVIGKDVFVFQRVNGKGILPYYYNQVSNVINSSCSKTGNGNTCATKLIRNGWKFSEDYPF